MAFVLSFAVMLATLAPPAHAHAAHPGLTVVATDMGEASGPERHSGAACHVCAGDAYAPAARTVLAFSRTGGVAAFAFWQDPTATRSPHFPPTRPPTA